MVVGELIRAGETQRNYSLVILFANWWGDARREGGDFGAAVALRGRAKTDDADTIISSPQQFSNL